MRKNLLFAVCLLLCGYISFADQSSSEKLKMIRKAANDARYKAYLKARQENKSPVIQTMNPPECKYYSTEGLYTLLSTHISPYPEIAHVNTVLNYKFPKKLGYWVAQDVTVYGRKDMGYSMRYYLDNETWADVYIYDMPFSMLRENIIIENEMMNVVNEIKEVYQNPEFSKEIANGSFLQDKKLTFCYLFAHFYRTVQGKNTLQGCKSFVLIFAKNRKFVKIRLTQYDKDSDVFDNTVSNFIEEFDKQVILDSKNRKEKFDYSLVYPIVL